MIMSSHNDNNSFAAAAGLVRLAQGARRFDGRRRIVVGDWRNRKFHPDGGRFGYSWLLAFMFFLTHRPRRAVSRDGASSDRRRLVGGHAPRSANISRRCCFRGWRFYFCPSRFSAKNLSMDVTWIRHNTFWLPPNGRCSPMPGFWITSAIFFGIWWLLTSRLSYWSLRQDETGEPLCTHKMRFHSGWGIVAFALTLTFSGVLWMQARAIPMVLGDLRRLFLRRLRVDRRWRRFMSSR